MNETFLSYFLNVVKINLRVSRDGYFLLDVNSKGYEVSKYIDTKVEVNPRMLSTLKKRKINIKHDPRGGFQYINDWTSGDFICLGQETNRSGFFQVRKICWETIHESFYC